VTYMWMIIIQSMHICNERYIYLTIHINLFFYKYINHPILHSFPTRRSSDLSTGAIGSLSTKGPGAFWINSSPVLVLLTFIQNARSEEHTSELQSRFDLVCRLLLEKKKNKHLF